MKRCLKTKTLKTPQNPIRGIIILPDLPLCSHTVVVAAALALLKQFLLSLSLSLGLPLVHTDRFSQKSSGNYKSLFPSKSMHLHSFRIKIISNMLYTVRKLGFCSLRLVNMFVNLTLWEPMST